MDRDELERDRRRFLVHGQRTFGLPWLFYGSLRANEVFDTVVGRTSASTMSEVVVLHRHELARIIAGDGFPGIFPTEEDTDLTCVMVSSLTREEELRIAWYEWDEYKLGRFTTADGRAAQAFVPDVEAIHRIHGAIDFQPWSFEDWRERHLADAILNAEEWMSEIPDVSGLLTAAE